MRARERARVRARVHARVRAHVRVFMCECSLVVSLFVAEDQTRTIRILS